MADVWPPANGMRRQGESSVDCAREQRPGQESLPQPRLAHTEVLQYLVSNNLIESRDEARKRRSQPDSRERRCERLRLEEAHMNLRDHVAPRAEPSAEWAGVAGRHEQHAARFQQSPDSLQHLDWIYRVLDDLNRCHDVKEATNSCQFARTEHRDS